MSCDPLLVPWERKRIAIFPYSLADKIWLLDYARANPHVRPQGLCQKIAAHVHGCNSTIPSPPESTVNSWFKQAHELRAENCTYAVCFQQCLCSVACPLLEAVLGSWLKQLKHFSITDEHLQDLARMLAHNPELKVPSKFEFSDEWVYDFKERSGMLPDPSPCSHAKRTGAVMELCPPLAAVVNPLRHTAASSRGFAPAPTSGVVCALTAPACRRASPAHVHPVSMQPGSINLASIRKALVQPPVQASAALTAHVAGATPTVVPAPSAAVSALADVLSVRLTGATSLQHAMDATVIATRKRTRALRDGIQPSAAARHTAQPPASSRGCAPAPTSAAASALTTPACPRPLAAPVHPASVNPASSRTAQAPVQPPSLLRAALAVTAASTSAASTSALEDVGLGVKLTFGDLHLRFRNDVVRAQMHTAVQPAARRYTQQGSAEYGSIRGLPLHVACTLFMSAFMKNARCVEATCFSCLLMHIFVHTWEVCGSVVDQMGVAADPGSSSVCLRQVMIGSGILANWIKFPEGATQLELQQSLVSVRAVCPFPFPTLRDPCQQVSIDMCGPA